MQRWRIINAVLVFFVIVLLFEIYNTWARTLVPVDLTPRPLPAATPSGGGARARRAAERNAGPPSEPVLVATIAEKDLFDPSRRPPPPEEMRPPDPVPRQVDPPAGVTFTGVRIMGPDREAFVTESGQRRRLRPGDSIANYTVKAVEPTRLVLLSPSGDPVTMRLGVAKPGGANTSTPGRGPARPGQPAASPAAGIQGNSPAAGVAVRPAVPPPVPPAPPAVAPGAQPATPQPPQNPQINQLPPDVRQKLEQLKAKDAGRRHGRDR
jgi:hypothetical protein